MKAVGYRNSLPISEAQSLVDVELPDPAPGTRRCQGARVTLRYAPETAPREGDKKAGAGRNPVKPPINREEHA
jgi:hypothetical protein